MASLGSFGAAAREYDPAVAERPTIEFYGETFTIWDEIPAILELTLTAAAAGKVSAFEGDVALHEALRHALSVPAHEADGKKVKADGAQWRRFAQLAADNCAPSELLTDVCFRIMGWQVGRPTEQRSTSSPGSLPTSTSSSSSASGSPGSPDSTPDAAGSAG